MCPVICTSRNAFLLGTDLSPLPVSHTPPPLSLMGTLFGLLPESLIPQWLL